MKRIMTLTLACALALGSVCTAQAVDLKVGGHWAFTFGWAENVAKFRGSFTDNNNRKEGKNNDNFIARQRVRTQIDFIASENLSAILLFEVGDLNYGGWSKGKNGVGSGADIDADGVNVKTKRACLDWVIPNTDVKLRMGIQGIYMPWAWGNGGNPIFANDVAGITLSSPIMDGLGLTAFWARPWDAYEYDPDGENKMDETDVFGLTLPITAIEGLSITPYAMYASIGADSGFWTYANLRTTGTVSERWTNTKTHAWYAGVSVNMAMFDPLVWVFDGMYGNLDGSGGLNNNPGSEGWYIVTALRYKTDWGTPGLFGWYASGDDEDAIKDGEYGRLPVIGFDWGAGLTSFGFDGGLPQITQDNVVGFSGVGTWGIGLEVADISFVDKLSHTIRVAYYTGTNDADLVKNRPDVFKNRYNNNLYLGDTQYMTDEDYAIEINFDHRYRIYENLTAFLELGYIHMDLDEGTWKNTNLGHETDGAWKALLSFQFLF